MNVNPKIIEVLSRRAQSIENGTFDEDTVKLFLIEIRDYLPGKSILREVADFVAHPERDRGLIHESVNYMYYRAKVLFEQLDGSIQLDLNNLRPELYYVVHWHFKKIKPNRSVIEYLQNTYKKDPRTQVFHPIKRDFARFAIYIKEAASLLSIESAIKEEDLQKELLLALPQVHLDSISQKIKERWSEFLLCILVLLHRSHFLMPDKSIASAYLSLRPTDNMEKHLIGLNATVKPTTGKPGISFPVIESNLSAEEYFSNSLLDNRFPGSPFKHYKATDDVLLKALRVSAHLLIEPS